MINPALQLIRRPVLASVGLVALLGLLGTALLVSADTSGTIGLTDDSGGNLVSGDTVTVTVTDDDLDTTGGADTVDVTITSSTTDSTGFTLELTETGATSGVFTGTFEVAAATNDGASPKQIGASAGEQVTATYDDVLDDGGGDPDAVSDSLTVDPSGATGTIALTDDNAGQLLIGDALTITVTDADLDTSGGADSVEVTVRSSATDTSGFAVTLTETGANTGVFTATIKLAVATNMGASPPELGASVGETVTASYDDVLDALGDDPAPVDDSLVVAPAGTTGAIVLTDDNAGGVLIGDTLTITVSDADLDTTGGADTVEVTVRSSATDTSGFARTLTETGANTGVFTATIKLAVATNMGASPPELGASVGETVTASYDDVLDALGDDPAPVDDSLLVVAGGTTGTVALTDDSAGQLLIGDTLTITVTDADLDTTGGADSVEVTVRSSATDTSGFAVTLTETGANTGVFTGTVKLAATTNAGASPPELGASVGELITATYDDALDANGLDPVPVVAFDTVDAGGATGSISLLDVNGGLLEIGDTLLVTVSDSDLDTTGGADSAVVTVHSSATDTSGFALILTETGANTGVFTATFKIESATNAGATPPELGASVGELITATYDDAHDAAGGDPAPVSATDTVDPVPPGSEGHDGIEGQGQGAGKEKVTVCHVPPGNPSRAHTITIGAPALGSHLGHGDTEGACS